MTERVTYATIRKLLTAADTIPGQSPAVRCAVMLRGAPHAISGVLSETAEGGLRMLSPLESGDLVEQFFDYEDVLVVAVQRSVTTSGPRIVAG